MNAKQAQTDKPKNIVVCSDGTGNSAKKDRGTNVFKLYEAVDLIEPPKDSKHRRQIAIYDDGVGTETWKPVRVRSGAFGLGCKLEGRNMNEKRAVYAAYATSFCIALAVLPDAHSGIVCYDRSSYSSNFVSAVQETLAKAGFDPGRVDGRWGARTARALDGFQRSKRLPVTGDINPATLRALFGANVSAGAYGLTPNPDLPTAVFKEECR